MCFIWRQFYLQQHVPYALVLERKISVANIKNRCVKIQVVENQLLTIFIVMWDIYPVNIAV